jgi:hypothetical protein
MQPVFFGAFYGYIIFITRLLNLSSPPQHNFSSDFTFPIKATLYMILKSYDFEGIIKMKWTVKLHQCFELELQQLNVDIQDELLAHALLLEKFGPQPGRPTVDTLKGSHYVNMKELRFRTKQGV